MLDQGLISVDEALKQIYSQSDKQYHEVLSMLYIIGMIILKRLLQWNLW